MDRTGPGCDGASALLHELIDLKADARDHARANSRELAGAIAQGARIYTSEGALPVEYLEPGDRIVTRSGTRELRAVLRGDYVGPLVRVAPGALGHDRPGAPLLLGPQARLLLRDWRVKLIYGKREALVAACSVVDGQYVTQVTARARLFALQFDAPEVIYADGVEIAMTPARVTV
ncbi:Hint domain-containing protein [Thioclava sp.]|uniref:Hint domain-containing protein n=1 Tax=Thioclava sp. TaxID=1933450 RepID=UPI003AA967B8